MSINEKDTKVVGNSNAPGRPKGGKKFGGRQKGTPNKTTLILKDILDDLQINVPKQLAELLPKLKPEKQADVLCELLQYIYPKRKAIELSGKDGEDLAGVQIVIKMPDNGRAEPITVNPNEKSD